MSEPNKTMDFEQIFNMACELPYCKINREEYLTKQLTGLVSQEQLKTALEDGTVNAGITIEILNHVARSSITNETSKATLISAAAGLPGGVAMVATVPADLVQFYAHVLRIAQKLAYIYGAKEIAFNDSTETTIMIYLGAMFGVTAAGAALVKFAAANAAKIGAKVAKQPLAKHAIYNISKKILAWVSVKLTKDVTGKAVTKAIPIVSGVLSGGLSVATFLPMANRLKNQLSKLAAMSPAELENANIEAGGILADFVVLGEAEQDSLPML